MTAYGVSTGSSIFMNKDLLPVILQEHYNQ